MCYCGLCGILLTDEDAEVESRMRPKVSGDSGNAARGFKANPIQRLQPIYQERPRHVCRKHQRDRARRGNHNQLCVYFSIPISFPALLLTMLGHRHSPGHNHSTADQETRQLGFQLYLRAVLRAARGSRSVRPAEGAHGGSLLRHAG